jgi:hypothetical protein
MDKVIDKLYYEFNGEDLVAALFVFESFKLFALERFQLDSTEKIEDEDERNRLITEENDELYRNILHRNGRNKRLILNLLRALSATNNNIDLVHETIKTYLIETETLDVPTLDELVKECIRIPNRNNIVYRAFLYQLFQIISAYIDRDGRGLNLRLDIINLLKVAANSLKEESYSDYLIFLEQMRKPLSPYNMRLIQAIGAVDVAWIKAMCNNLNYVTDEPNYNALLWLLNSIIDQTIKEDIETAERQRQEIYKDIDKLLKLKEQLNSRILK